MTDPVTKRDDDLLRAVGQSDRAGVRLALMRGGDPRTGWPDAPLLHIASVRGDADIVAMLLEAGADVDATDTDGRTALMCLACSGTSPGHARAANLLLEAGSDPGVKEEKGRTVLDLAAAFGNASLAALLRSRDAPVSRKSLSRLQQVSGADSPSR